MVLIKRCIVHIPNKLDFSGKSGSNVRPLMMIKAFQSIGYDVALVMGYGKERRSAINNIKQQIKSGVKFDFLYSESSTMPTLLTEKNHLPLYPDLDFGFFSFCKKNGIKIGLFYRDIYWRFPEYRSYFKGIHILEYYAAELAYRYDLLRYSSLVDVFYTPSHLMHKHIRKTILEQKGKELPPGSVLDENVINLQKNKFLQRKNISRQEIRVFYVGGLGNQYQIQDVLKGIYELDNVYLTLCCREKEFADYYDSIKDYFTDRITVVHKSGAELEEFYNEADVCLALFKPDIYIEMAVPIKLYEYLSHTIPIIASDGTYSGQIVSNNAIGWTIKYSAEDVKKCFLEVLSDYAEIYRKHCNCVDVLQKNRWEDRALQVKSDLFDEWNV